MNKRFLGLLALAVLSTVALASCSGDGLFSKKNAPATIAAACQGVQAANNTFQIFAAQHPGKIDANGMSTEGTIMDAVGLPVDGKSAVAPGSVCDPSAPLNLATAEATLLRASLGIANLLSVWVT